MGETPELTLTPTPNRAPDLLRSEGLSLPARDPLLRRSFCAAGQPAYSQVSLCIRLSGSDPKFLAFRPIRHAAGTSSAVAYGGRHLGALVLVVTAAFTPVGGAQDNDRHEPGTRASPAAARD
jgi:hypothetical protein